MKKSLFSRGPKILGGIQERSPGQVEAERPAKRLKALLDEDDTSSEEDQVPSHDTAVLMRNDESETGGHGFKVNHEFARRFEHNKKREELHRREWCFAQSYPTDITY